MASRSDAIEQLVDEVRLLWNTLVERGERLHDREGDVTMAMRAVLEYLLRNGPTTVPNVARARHVTRQHIQVQVNELLDAGLVKLVENPAHKRSPLVALSRTGERRIARMREREASVFASASIQTSAAELQRAAAALRDVREAVES